MSSIAKTNHTPSHTSALREIAKRLEVPIQAVRYLYNGKRTMNNGYSERKTRAINRRRAYLAEHEIVLLARKHGFEATRIPLSGAGAMRGDGLLTLPNGKRLLLEVKSTAVTNSVGLGVFPLRMEYVRTLDENVVAMRQYNVACGVFILRFVNVGAFFTVIEQPAMDTIAGMVGVPFHEVVHPNYGKPCIDLFERIETAGKTLSINALAASYGRVYLHTDTTTEPSTRRVFYVFGVNMLLRWLDYLRGTNDEAASS